MQGGKHRGDVIVPLYSSNESGCSVLYLVDMVQKACTTSCTSVIDKSEREMRWKMCQHNAKWTKDFSLLAVDEGQQLSFCCWSREAPEEVRGDDPSIRIPFIKICLPTDTGCDLNLLPPVKEQRNLLESSFQLFSFSDSITNKRTTLQIYTV